MRRVLIVSPHFPPLNAPDLQRVRISLPHYRQFGWEPVVLTVRDDLQLGVREPELLSTVPSDVTILRANGLPPRLARLAGVGNVALRTWPGLLRTGGRFLREAKCDLVFFSNTQFMSFTLGPLWRRRFGVRYVLDFQDPWLTDYYERPGSPRPPGGWKYRFSRWQARAFEGPCVRGAAGLMSVSPSYLGDLAARYPSAAGLPSAVLPFGVSPADLERARAEPAGGSSPFPRAEGQIHFVYTGAVGPIMAPALRGLLSAVADLQRREPLTARRARFHFIGTSYAAPGSGVPSVKPIAREFGVEDLVEESPHRVGYLEAARLQQQADCLLLLGSTDPAYSPSKIYLNYLTGRPMLAIVYRGSEMERRLEELRCARLIRLGSPTDPGVAAAALSESLRAALQGKPIGGETGRNDAFFRSNYLAEELTRRQCALFDAALA
ncbi:MAG TPA: glycosyltransferase [Opitutaceae bacterium]|jgi:hypothetical protein